MSKKSDTEIWLIHNLGKFTSIWGIAHAALREACWCGSLPPAEHGTCVACEAIKECEQIIMDAK